MKILAEDVAHTSSFSVAGRCPICLHNGVFHPIGGVSDALLADRPVQLGVRRCPNRECLALVFVVIKDQSLWFSYPPERIDFDATDIPVGVLTTFEEAISCHANESYVASAIMVRRTLEEICEDKGAVGNNLHERLKALGKVVVLPQELLDGMFELKLLGNDAAHIKSKDYGSIDKQEVDVAFMLAKEILKAVYQYSALLKALQSLKK